MAFDPLTLGATALIFKSVLETVAGKAAEDFAKDFFKKSLKNVLTPESKPLIAAAGKALKEFLELFENELVGAGYDVPTIDTFERPLTLFLRDDEVKITLAAAFEGYASTVSSAKLAAAWKRLKLPKLTRQFSWTRFARVYANKVHAVREGSPELRALLDSRAHAATADASERLAGRAVGFDLEKYRTAMVTKYRHLRLHEIEAGTTYEAPVRLDRLFVEQNARNNDSLPARLYELPKEIRQYLESGTAESIRAAGLSVQDLANLRHSFRDQPIYPILKIAADIELPFLVVLGDPGSGKSTLLQYLLLRWTKADVSERDSLPVPLLVELREYARARLKDGTRVKDFLSFLEHGASIPCQLDARALHDALVDGRAHLLLDGLDEVFDHDLRREVVETIGRATRDYPTARIIVTSRVFGYEPHVLREAGFRHFLLLDLETEQIHDFLDRWHRLTFPTDTREREIKHTRLRQALTDSTAIRELAGNPLLLTLMAILNRSRELPRDRASLFEQSAQLLLQQWKVEDAMRADRVLHDVLLDFKDKQQLLRAVARAMQDGPHGLAGNLIESDQLEDVLVAAMPGHVKKDNQVPVARALVNQLRGRNFILCAIGADRYAFVHRTFLEYFCTAEILWRFEKTKELANVEALVAKTFAPHWQDERWHEVLLLIAGSIEPKFVSEIIRFLLDQPLSQALEDPGTQVLLAARCVGEVRERGALGGQAGRAKDAAKAFVERGPYENIDIMCWADEMEPHIRQAVNIVGKVWMGEEDVREWLVWLVEKPNSLFYGTQDVALQELSQNWKEDERTFPYLMEAAKRLDSWTAVAELASGWGDRPQVHALMLDLVRNGTHEAAVNSAAGQLISLWRDEPQTFPEILQRAKKSPYHVKFDLCDLLRQQWPIRPEVRQLWKAVRAEEQELNSSIEEGEQR